MRRPARRPRLVRPPRKSLHRPTSRKLASRVNRTPRASRVVTSCPPPLPPSVIAGPSPRSRTATPTAGLAATLARLLRDKMVVTPEAEEICLVASEFACDACFQDDMSCCLPRCCIQAGGNGLPIPKPYPCATEIARARIAWMHTALHCTALHSHPWTIRQLVN